MIPILGVILAIGLVCLTILIMWFIFANPQVDERASEKAREEANYVAESNSSQCCKRCWYSFRVLSKDRIARCCGLLDIETNDRSTCDNFEEKEDIE